MVLGVFKKIKKLIKLRKLEEKTEPWKKPIKPIKILKKPTGSVRFRFSKPGIEKTELNRTEPKPEKTEPKPKKPSQTEPKSSQTGKNRAKPVWTDFCSKKPNRTEPSWFEPVSVRFRFFKKKNFSLVIFKKKKPNRIENEHPYMVPWRMGDGPQENVD